VKNLNLDKKTVFFWNKGGAHTYLAMRLAEDYKKVIVYTPAKDKIYPDPQDHYIGFGLPGLTLAHSFEEYRRGNEIDLWVFPFTGDGDVQESLRLEGKRVYGSGAAERLEFNRVDYKRTLKSRGLPTAPDKIFTGIDDLRKLSRDDPDWWIKIFGEDSTYRGLAETFHLDTYAKSVNRLDELSVKLGFLRDIWQFMGEKPLPGCETGSDRDFSRGKTLKIGTWGYEIKNLGYLCRVTELDKFPKMIREANDAMAPVWARYPIGFKLSDEIRIVKRRPYPVDLTPRWGSPPGEIHSRLYKNVSEMIWCQAGGEDVVPEPILGADGKPVKYAASVNIKSPDAVLSSLPMEIKDKDMDKVLLKSACKIGKQVYNIPSRPEDHDDEVATAIGFGSIPEEAMQACMENAELIDAQGLWYPGDVFDEVDEVLEKAAKAGLEKL